MPAWKVNLRTRQFTKRIFSLFIVFCHFFTINMLSSPTMKVHKALGNFWGIKRPFLSLTCVKQNFLLPSSLTNLPLKKKTDNGLHQKRNTCKRRRERCPKYTAIVTVRMWPIYVTVKYEISRLFVIHTFC